MRTTLDIPDETFRQLKAQAALNGMKLKELVTQLIQRGLAAGPNQPTPSRAHTPSPMAIDRFSAETTAAARALIYPIPIAREADGTVTAYLTNSQLNAILDEGDLAQHQRVVSGTSGQ